jgi:hypothetical protein
MITMIQRLFRRFFMFRKRNKRNIKLNNEISQQKYY